MEDGYCAENALDDITFAIGCTNEVDNSYFNISFEEVKKRLRKLLTLKLKGE